MYFCTCKDSRAELAAQTSSAIPHWIYAHWTRQALSNLILSHINAPGLEHTDPDKIANFDSLGEQVLTRVESTIWRWIECCQ